MTYLYYIIAISLLFIMALLLCIMYLTRQDKKRQVTRRTRRTTKYGHFKLAIYRFISSSKLTRRYVLSIRKRYELVTGLKEVYLRQKVVDTFITLVFVSISILGVFAFITRSILSVLFVAMIVIFMAESLVDIFVIHENNKLMKDQVIFNNKVRHYYYEYNDILEAIYEASDSMLEDQPQMSGQGMVIYDTLNSKNVEEEIQNYNDLAPNRFLKMFCGLSYISKEYGDSGDSSGRSNFLSNLTTLNEEIRLELFKRENIAYYFRSLNVITLVPLLFINSMKTWASSNFYPMERFYDSNQGYLLEIIMYLITLMSYVIIRGLQQTESTYKIRHKAKTLPRFVKSLLAIITPMKHTSMRMKKEKLIKATGQNMTIDDLYLRKLAIALVSFILATIVIFALHQQTIKNIYNKADVEAVQESFLGGALSDEDLGLAESITREDGLILKALNRHDSLADIEAKIASLTNLSDEEIRDMAKRVYEKAQTINSAYFKWYELLLVIGLTIIAYQLPDMILIYQRRVMKVEIENEVSQFQMTILMLMHVPRISVEDVLIWMCDYSQLFKEVLEKCLMDYDSGPEIALETLKESVQDQGFKEVLSGIQRAVTSLSLKEAFDELEAEKAYFLKQREVMNKRIIESKRSSGSFIGFMPTYALIGLYFGMPLVLTSMKEVTKFYDLLLGI